MAKPEGMTPATREVIVRAIAKGITIEAAAGIAGVHVTTVHRWRRGSRPVERRFAAEVDRARAEAEAALPDPVTEDEHRRLVAEAARKGSVQAMKLAWTMILADRRAEDENAEAADDPLAGIDEIAAARVRRQR